MKLYKIWGCLVGVALILAACGQGEKRSPVTQDSFADMTLGQYHISEKRIRTHIADLMFEDRDHMGADLRVKDYYKNHGPFLWIGRDGVRQSADSVLKYVARVSEMGFSPKRFRLQAIARDLGRLRRLSLDDDDINHLLARVEYNLSKAYLNYAMGQRFGYTSPKRLYNRLDVRDSDSVGVSYRTLFDLPVKQPGHTFVVHAFNQVRHDSVGVFLSQSGTDDALYQRLQAMLPKARTAAQRRLLLVNMERCRWALADKPSRHSQYVLLNIPSQELDAVNDAQTLRMRVVCGSTETKTPLLQSYIHRIDINPQWIIPKSIVKKSVARHAGNAAYFNSRRYFILERKTGKEVNPALATPAMLMDKGYLVIQRGGKGNALGRMIFRFNNKFSVFLHDTSNRDLFASSARLASHGCVRVQHPYDLAVFLLGDKDEDLLEKIRYSTTVDLPVEPEAGAEAGAATADIDRSKLVRSANVEPKVPLYIVYFTMFNTADGQLLTYPDIYGYDGVLYDSLKHYL